MKYLTEQFNELINNESFYNSCANAAKNLGISATEWNENKAMFIQMFAIEIITK